MRCKGCFAHFKNLRGLRVSFSSAAPVIDRLAKLSESFSIKKISFSGGEPTLVEDMPEIVRHAHAAGFITSLITNGSRISESWLSTMHESLNWLGISIDSLIPKTNIKLGRTVNGSPLDAATYRRICSMTQEFNIRLKINTVVSKLNASEVLAGWINEIGPLRWKVMQALKLEGENADQSEFFTGPADFQSFVTRNQFASPVAERDVDMIGSYAMISPDGRLLNNDSSRLSYGASVMDVNEAEFLTWYGAFDQKLRERGGLYDWNGTVKSQLSRPLGRHIRFSAATHEDMVA